MTKKEVETKIAEYNNNRSTMTAADASALFAQIEADCKTLNTETHKATLDKLVEKPAQSAIILEVIEGVTCEKYKAEIDSKSGEARLKDSTPEIEWHTIATAYEDKHGQSLAKDSTFTTEAEGFFKKLLAYDGAAQSEEGAAAIIKKGDKSEAVKNKISKTVLMNNLVQVCNALLPDDIAIKPIKRDLNRLLSAINGAKGRKQTSATNKTMYKQLFEVIKTNRSGEAYEIKCRL